MDGRGRGRGGRGQYSRTFPQPGRGSGNAPICRFWGEGTCFKGAACQFQHQGPGRGGGGPGGGGGGFQGRWDNGSSANGGGMGGGGDGRPRERAPQWGGARGGQGGRGGRGPRVQRRKVEAVCRFWLQQRCQKGDDCSFLHAHTTTTEVEMMADLQGHEQAVRAITLPANEGKLYTGSQDGSVRVWDCVSGQCTSVVPVGADVGAILSISGWLFVGIPGAIKSWDTSTSAHHELTGFQGQVHALAVGGSVLFSGIHDGRILAWKLNPASGQFEMAGALTGHSGAVITMHASEGAGGARLFSGSLDKSIRVWDLNSGQCVATLSGHTHAVMAMIMWDQYLLSGSLDGTVKVWDAAGVGDVSANYSFPSVEELSSAPGNGVLALCGTMDHSGKPVLLCAYNDNSVRLLDLPAFTDRGALLSGVEVRVLAAGPGGLFFSGDSNGLVKVWRWTQPSTTT